MTDIVERLRFLGAGEPFRGALMREAAEEIERLRDAIKRQASAAKTGMDAATRISSAQLEQARIMRAESSPAAIDSERDANAMLTNEIERLRAELAAAKRNSERLQGLIDEHNAACISRCGDGEQEAVACGYRPYFVNNGRRCPTCPRDEMIDIAP